MTESLTSGICYFQPIPRKIAFQLQVGTIRSMLKKIRTQRERKEKKHSELRKDGYIN